MIFDNGKFTKYRDLQKIKRWRTLSKWEGQGKLSDYTIDCEYGNIKNSLEKQIDLKVDKSFCRELKFL